MGMGKGMDSLEAGDGESRFGQWLRRRRRHLDLTQTQLADCAACSLTTIRKFETGERRPSRDLAAVLATCLHVPPEELESFIRFARGLQADYEVPAPPSENVIRSATQSLPPARPFAVLPSPATPFVGREQELAQIATRLADPACRLLTLVGTGGMGKTRLALAAATTEQHRFADGAVFVSLAAVTDPAQLPQAIAAPLGVPLTGAEDPARQLVNILREKRLLLVLDNFEQLLEAAALLGSWLTELPNAKWLVTSRERLNLLEEWLLPVQGFADRDPGVALFVQSARRVQPDFSLDGQEAAVAQICHYVGGMPLAIELAAGWMTLLSAEQILARMQQTFDFLSTSLRNVPQRHRSLRHLFDQTWELLSADEQGLLTKLSVFRGGFAATEAEAVGEADLLHLLALVNKSLVTAAGNGRYTLHELTRHYATEKLHERGEETATQQQHLQAYLALAETAEPQLYGAEAIPWFQRLAEEQDNFRAALTFATQAEHGDLALCLASKLWWFWFRRGFWREAEQWLALALETAETADSPVRCRALLGLTTCIALQGRYAEATPYLLEAVAMARRLGDGELLVSALLVVGQAIPDLDHSLATFAEAQAVWEQDSDRQRPSTAAYLHYLVGDRLRENGRYGEAAERYRQSLALYRQIGNVDSIAYPLGNLGRLALQDGRLAEANELIGESLAVSRAIGNRQGLSDWLIPQGVVALYMGDVVAAETCLQEALLLHSESGNQRGRAEALSCLALVCLAQNDRVRAAQYSGDSLDVYHENWQHSRAVHLAPSADSDRIVPDLVDAFFVAALVRAAQGQWEPAAMCLAICRRWQQRIEHQLIPVLQQQIEAAEATVRQQLDVAEWEAAWAAVQNWTLEDVFRFLSQQRPGSL